MNYETINYAYLSGFLESELRALTYDPHYLDFAPGDYAGRADYVKKLIEDARQKAIDYDKQAKSA